MTTPASLERRNDPPSNVRKPCPPAYSWSCRWLAGSGRLDLPQNLAASQQYLRDFTTVAKGGTVEDPVHGMLELHGDRDQPHTLWISARAEVARRA